MYRLAMERAAEPREILEAGQILALAGCEGELDARRRAWTARSMAQWMDRTGAAETSTRTLFAELVQFEDAIDRAMASVCQQGPLVSALLCNKSPEPSTLAQLDRLELLGRLTDRDRLGYLARCSGAHCLRDAEAVEWSRAVELVRTETDREILVLMAQAALLRVHARHRKALPPGPEVIAARARWKSEIFDVEPTLVVEVAQLVDFAQRGEPIPACPEALRATVQRRLRGTPPRADDLAGLADPLTQILFRGLTLCDRADPALVQHRAGRLDRLPPLLGPRSMVAVATGTTPKPLPPTARPHVLAAVGTVAKIDPPKDGRISVHLRGKTRKEPVERCQEVAHARRGSQATVIERCRVVGKETIEVVPAPVMFDQGVAKHLRKGDRIGFHPDTTWDLDYARFVNGKRENDGNALHPATLLYAGSYWLGLDLAP
jgi:hypothetical protein